MEQGAVIVDVCVRGGLSAKEVCVVLRGVCRGWRDAVDAAGDALWHSMCLRDFDRMSSATLESSQGCWKNIYKFMFQKPCVGDIVQVYLPEYTDWKAFRVILRLNERVILVGTTAPSRRAVPTVFWVDAVSDKSSLRNLNFCTTICPFSATRKTHIKWFQYIQSRAISLMIHGGHWPAPPPLLRLSSYKRDSEPATSPEPTFSLRQDLSGTPDSCPNYVISKRPDIEPYWKGLQCGPSLLQVSYGILVSPTIGSQLKVQDTVNKWYAARIVDVDPTSDRIQVHYLGWGDNWNEWIPFYSQAHRLQERGPFETIGPVPEDCQFNTAVQAKFLPWNEFLHSEFYEPSKWHKMDTYRTVHHPVVGGLLTVFDMRNMSHPAMVIDLSGESITVVSASSAVDTLHVIDDRNRLVPYTHKGPDDLDDVITRLVSFCPDDFSEAVQHAEHPILAFADLPDSEEPTYDFF
ncbi:hypothetical protein Pelo_85 [Pelomyxa schiedti]|nr:hypothetical protein Pelo_85 [Pelomyxa schiedti]